MTYKRLWHIFRTALMKNGFKRAEYLRKTKVFAQMGQNCFWQPRNIPPEAKLIRIHDNVVVASEVLFVNHDVMHHVFNRIDVQHHFTAKFGAIEIGSNVFIGSRSVILPDTCIEDNVIIGAGSLVKGKISSGGVYAGVPAKRIGDFDAIWKKRAAEEPPAKDREERFRNVWKQFDDKFAQ